MSGYSRTLRTYWEREGWDRAQHVNGRGMTSLAIVRYFDPEWHIRAPELIAARRKGARAFQARKPRP